MVNDEGVLRLAIPEAITGGFDQTASGAFVFALASDVAGQYGSLATTNLVTLDGKLDLDPWNGFTLAAGDSVDLMIFAAVSGNFSLFSLKGVGCSSFSTDVWTCSNAAGLYFDAVFGSGSLALDVSSSPLLFPANSSSTVPEPASWVMMLMGFAGLGLAGRPGRRLLDRVSPARAPLLVSAILCTAAALSGRQQAHD